MLWSCESEAMAERALVEEVDEIVMTISLLPGPVGRVVSADAEELLRTLAMTVLLGRER